MSAGGGKDNGPREEAADGTGQPREEAAGRSAQRGDAAGKQAVRGPASGGLLPNKAAEDDPRRWGDEAGSYDHDAWLREQRPPHWG